VLDTAIPARNREVMRSPSSSVGNQWRELGESFPAAATPVSPAA